VFLLYIYIYIIIPCVSVIYIYYRSVCFCYIYKYILSFRVFLLSALALTFEDDPELRPGRRAPDVGRVLDVAEERPVVAELSRVELDGHVPLVDVPDEPDAVFELVLAREPFPIGQVVDLTGNRKPASRISFTQKHFGYFLHQNNNS